MELFYEYKPIPMAIYLVTDPQELNQQILNTINGSRRSMVPLWYHNILKSIWKKYVTLFELRPIYPESRENQVNILIPTSSRWLEKIYFKFP